MSEVTRLGAANLCSTVRTSADAMDDVAAAIKVAEMAKWQSRSGHRRKIDVAMSNNHHHNYQNKSAPAD